MQKTRASYKKHGLIDTAEYKAWGAMRGRCFNPRDRAYHSYGGRGIKVCIRWFDFENFFADMGKRPTQNHSLDRIDNNGDYTPENCRWATFSQQMNNRSNSLEKYSYEGKTLSIADWARETGLGYGTLKDRLIKFNWSIDKALTKPLPKPRQKFFTYQGKRLTLKEWSESTGIKYQTLYSRIFRDKMTIETALRR